MPLKIIIILLLFLGILCITISITKNIQSQQCPQPKIIYRYIPRTFKQEQDEPIYPSDVFRTMFEKPDPWMLSVGALDSHKNEAINKYFVSQEQNRFTVH